MSVIARRTPSGYSGRYHHTCGDPYNLGKALYRLHNGYFGGNTAALLRVLIDEHPAGWSDIIGMDFTLPPGFVEPRSGLSPKQFLRVPDARRPQCYCHGDRSEEPVTFTEVSTPMCVDFLYLIDPTSHVMDIHVYKSWPQEGKPELLLIGSVPLDGPEPSWRRYRSERILYTKEEWKRMQQERDEEVYPSEEEWRQIMREAVEDEPHASDPLEGSGEDPFLGR